MTILVDMDDVLEQLLDGMIRYINSRYGTKTTLDDIREWELASAFGSGFLEGRQADARSQRGTAETDRRRP